MNCSQIIMLYNDKNMTEYIINNYSRKNDQFSPKREIMYVIPHNYVYNHNLMIMESNEFQNLQS
jgi:hypothetical protein